jgi:anthranilate synthase component II
MILMIDNYDSFTYNLVQYFGELKQEIKVFRNDKISIKEIKNMNPKFIVISPGPGAPVDAGISLSIIKEFGGIIPILGVCLGHQVIANHFGGKIIRAKEIKHGKTSLIYHSQQSIFNNLSIPFTATRYHSLVVEKQSLPSCLRITAWTQDNDAKMDEIMAVKHESLAIEGVQFHPESILSEYGHHILENFLNKYQS